MADTPARTRNDPTAQGLEDWDRQPGESPELYTAFCAYRDQVYGNRSIRNAAKTCGKSEGYLGQISGRNRWVARAAAYDRHLDIIRRREAEEQATQMGKRQATQLAAASQALTAPIQALIARVAAARSKGQDPFSELKPAELSRLATAAARHLPQVVEAERLVAGLSTANIHEGAPASVEEARRRADEMPREKLDEYLVGVDDGRRNLAAELGIPADEVMGITPVGPAGGQQ